MRLAKLLRFLRYYINKRAVHYILLRTHTHMVVAAHSQFIYFNFVTDFRYVSLAGRVDLFVAPVRCFSYTANNIVLFDFVARGEVFSS